jgi:hypothetical protein
MRFAHTTATALVLAGSMTVLTGCGDVRPGGASGWTVAIDTTAAGAVRVVNSPPARGIEPTWVIDEEVRIGALDDGGPASFGQVKGLVVDDRDRIWVLDAQAQELRVFGPDGAHLRTLGRRGEGPGEFAGANGIMRAPDGRIWVVDPQLARMSVFDPEAGFETSHRWDRRSWGFIWQGRFDGAGRVIEPSTATWDGQQRMALRIYGPAMQLMDSIPLEPLPPPGGEAPAAYRWEAAGMWGYMQVPFYPQSHKALDEKAAFWGTRDGDADYRLVRWNPGGDTTLVVESRRPPVPVQAAERDSAIAALQDVLRQRGASTRLDWSRIPDVRPAIAGLFLADDGDVWTRVTTPDDAVTTWDVFSPDGRYRGTAVAPFRPYRWLPPVVRGDRLWLVVTDELDVQYVVAGRLRPAGSGGSAESGESGE